MHQPDKGSSTLRQLQGDQGDVPNQVQQQRAADIQAAEYGDDVNHDRNGVVETLPARPVSLVIPVKQGEDHVEKIVSLPYIKQGKRLRRRVVRKPPDAKTKPDLPPPKASGAADPSPSQHTMTLFQGSLVLDGNLRVNNADHPHSR